MTITVGDLRRKAQREMEFGHGTLVSGPAVLPNGEPNDALVLRFGERERLPRPTHVFFLRRLVIRAGPGAGRYAELSTFEDWPVFKSSRFAVSWKVTPRNWHWFCRAPIKMVKT